MKTHAHAHMDDLLKVAGAGLMGTLSPMIARLAEGDIVGWLSLFLKFGPPLLTVIYIGSKIYWLWKNEGK